MNSDATEDVVRNLTVNVEYKTWFDDYLNDLEGMAKNLLRSGVPKAKVKKIVAMNIKEVAPEATEVRF